MARRPRPGSGSFRTVYQAYGEPPVTVALKSSKHGPGARTARRAQYLAGYTQVMRGHIVAGGSPALRAGARRAEDHQYYMNYPKKQHMPKAAGRFAVHGRLAANVSNTNPRSATGNKQIDLARTFGAGPRRALLSTRAGFTPVFKPGNPVPSVKLSGPAAGQGRTRTARRAQYLSGLLQGQLAVNHPLSQPGQVKKLARTGAWKAGYLRGAGRRSSKPISNAAKFWIQMSNGRFAGSMAGAPKGSGGRRR